LIGEYSTAIETAAPKVQYLTADHLGSPRILTDQNGTTISRRDFMPYGEEIATPERHPNLSYTAVDVRQNFTGYERDGETGLDYAQARYYAKNLGRFNSVDPLMGSAAATVPQSWNRYLYVENNPLVYIDDTGLLKRRKDKKLDMRVTNRQSGFENSGKKFEAVMGYLITDSGGRRIEAFYSLDNDRAGDANCHGLTFGDGEFSINNRVIPTLLQYDGYQVIDAAAAKGGDVVVWEEAVYAKKGDDKGKIIRWDVVHSATVTDVNNGSVQVSGINGTQMSSDTSSIEGAALPQARSTNPTTGQAAERRSTIYTKPSMSEEERTANVSRARNFSKSDSKLEDRKKRSQDFRDDPSASIVQ